MITARTTIRAVGAAGAAGALVLPDSPATAADTATLSVLHAVPDLPVDVHANGERLIDDFQPGTLTDPLQLPAGSYDLALFPADAADGSGEPLLSAAGVAVPAGADATVVAHLTAEGQPALTPFVNDVSAVPAGTVSADVVLAGTGTVAIGPADLPLAEGTTNIVYAWGSQDAGYELAVQTISGGHSAPSGVPGGTAGLVDDGSLPMPVAALSVTGLVAAGAGALRLARSRG